MPRAIAKTRARAQVIERALPLFVSLAERFGRNRTRRARLRDEYLKEIKESRVIRSCWVARITDLRRVIQEVVGEDVRLIDSGEAAGMMSKRS